MKAYISSLVDRNLDSYLISLLAEELSSLDVTSIPSLSKAYTDKDLWDYQKSEIRQCDIFIGIMTESPPDLRRTLFLLETEESIKHRIPTFLLIEDSLNIPPAFFNQFGVEVLRFKRHSPDVVISNLKNKFDEIQSNLTKSKDLQKDFVLIAGIIALMAFFDRIK